MKKTLIKFFEKIAADNIFTQAAAVAFYAAMSIAPMLLLLVVALGFFDLNLTDNLSAQVSHLFGAKAANYLLSVIKSAKTTPHLGSRSGWIAVVVMFVLSSALFLQLLSALNTIFLNRKEGMRALSHFHLLWTVFLRRVFSYVMVVAFLLVTTASLVISSLIAYFFVTNDNQWVQFLNELISFLIFTGLLTCLFKWVPDQKVHVGGALLGGLLTAALFLIGKILITFYLNHMALASAYGAAGSLIVFLMWAYYSSLVIFIGAEVSAVWFMQEKQQ